MNMTLLHYRKKFMGVLKRAETLPKYKIKFLKFSLKKLINIIYYNP